MTEQFDPTAVTGLNLGEIPDIGLDTELNNDSAPFLGVVVIDEYQPNRAKDGWEWHLGVRPVDFALRSDDNPFRCFHANAGISVKKNSKMGAMLEAFGTTRGKGKTKVGKNELLGYTAIFVRRTLTWSNRDGSSIEARVIIPVRAATDEELARATNLDQSQGPSAVPTVAPAPAPAELSDEALQAILAVIDGKTAQEFQMAAITSGLAPDLMSLVLSGKALEILKGKGLVAIGPDGKVNSQAVLV